MARLATCGWESGFDSGAADRRNEFNGMDIGGGALSGAGTCAVVTNPAWWSSGGNYVMKMTGAACRTDYTGTPVWSGVKFGFDALPGSDTTIITDPFVPFFKVVLKTNGKLELWTGPTASTLRGTSTITLAAQTCYLIEIRWIQNVMCQLWINGKLEVSTTTVDNTVAKLTLLGSQLAAFATYWDDYYANDTLTTNSSGQYGRRGWASIMPALSPNVDVGGAPGGTWGNSAGLTWGNATTGWFSAIDDPPGAVSATDYISKTSQDGNVAPIGYADAPAGAKPNTMYTVIWAMNDGTGASTFRQFPRYLLSGNGGSSTFSMVAGSTPLCYTSSLSHQNEPRQFSGSFLGGPAFKKSSIDGFRTDWLSSTAEDVTPPARICAAYLLYEQYDTVTVPSLVLQQGMLNMDPDQTTQDVVGMPAAPKALIAIAASLTAEGAGNPTAVMFGASAGSTKDAVISGGATDAQTAAQTERKNDNTRSFSMINGAGTVLGVGHILSFNGDGYTIGWDTHPTSAYVAQYLALGGSAITNVATGKFTPNGIVGNQAITGVGFRPDLVIMFTTLSTVGASTGMNFAIGAMSSDTSQGFCAYRDRNAANPTSTGVYQRTDRCLAAIADASDAVAMECSWVSMDTDGFQVNWQVAGPAVDVHFIAIKGGIYHIGSDTCPTATGTKTTTVGIAPLAVMFLGVGRAGSTSPDYTTTAKMTLGLTDGRAEGSVYFAADDNVTPSNVSEYAGLSDSLVNGDASGAVNSHGTLYSLDSNGFTTYWTMADAVAREFLYIAIGTQQNTVLDSGIVTATIGVTGTGSASGGTIPDSGTVDVTTGASGTGSVTGSAIDSGGVTAVVGVTATQAVLGAAGSPSNTVAPIISGTPAVNRIVQCWPGSWTNDPTAYAFQWQRDVAGNGVWSNIGGATNHYYVLVSADANNRVRCNVTPANGAGNGPTTASNATRIVGAAPPGTVHES